MVESEEPLDQLLKLTMTHPCGIRKLHVTVYNIGFYSNSISASFSSLF